MLPKLKKAKHRAYLDGNFARRKAPPEPLEYIVWDSELAGFGLRVRPSGTKTWFVRLYQRGQYRRVSLGRVEDVDASTVRLQARRLLAEAALDGLPKRPTVKLAPVFADYVQEFWQDYAHHWKLSTQKRNLHAITRHIMPHFSAMRLDTIRRADITRWRDSCALTQEALFNRALPVLSAMLKYAEQLGYIPKRSNPCRGTPRFKMRAMERFLSAAEYHRLAQGLAREEAAHPDKVAMIRLLLFTGARQGEIGTLQWDWVQAPRLLLPDSKTGPKTIWLNSQAQRILERIPRREGVPLVFPNATGKRPLSMSGWWIKVRRQCALPDVRIHDLRHSFASAAIRHNVPLATIGGLLGHALPETTAKYAHLADDVIAEAAARVSGGIANALGLAA